MAERNLYLTNLPVEEALGRFQNALGPLLKMDAEEIEVIQALGRVTAAAVYARYNSPLYDSAAMDGVAVVSALTRGASETNPVKLRLGEDYLAVDTGDPVRPPYDAVIMAEEIQESDGDTIVIHAAAAPWQDIRPVGEDIVQGEMILPGGHKIRPIDIGVLLSGGVVRVAVRKRPAVAIIPTGTEMVEPGDDIGEDSIIESNSRMLAGLVEQCGGAPSRFIPVPDEYELIKERLQDAAERFDAVLICAGTSAGREDYTVHILREIGEVFAHGVAIKPGKPVVLAMVNGKPVIGVPGYPVSAYLAYDIFAAPVLAAMTGVSGAGAPVIKAVLTRRLVSSLKYREYVRVKVGRIGERLVASPLARGAGAAMSLVRADGFCIIDQDSEGVEAGAEVDVVLCRGLEDLDGMVVSIGSHDLILDVIADLMPTSFPGTNLSSTHTGSMGGLLALKNGETHIAPTHLLDEGTGTYNIQALKSLFPGRQIALVKGVGRVQGVMVKKGNPLGVKGIGDLPRCRYINRQRGAGTRLLLDYLLKTEGVDPVSIKGYEREAATHMAVAAAISSGSADAGLGILSAAKAMGLDFIPIGDEEYDFAVLPAFLDAPHVRAFIHMLKSTGFRQKLDELGGYTAERCGEVIIVDC
ncbi:MAG: molybdopterin biosynthesis protein [Peptococcaceae bacterium]|jgi:putative molybdopterin biosynthesis protein|nr:molybdopterin biosynthesis protein [Peptococcaceae bacterium]